MNLERDGMPARAWPSAQIATYQRSINPMSYFDEDDVIRNPQTRDRRAWVACALQGARRRLASGTSSAGFGALSEMPPKPRLSVVPSGHKR